MTTKTKPLPVNHKGQPCIVTVRLCQEGYCTECQLYRDWLNSKLERFTRGN